MNDATRDSPALPAPAPAAAGARAPQALEDCLLFIAAQHGRPLSLAALRAGIARPQADWRLDDFVEAAESLGLRTQVLAQAEPPRAEPGHPLLLLGHGGDALVLISHDKDGRFEAHLPETRRTQWLSRAELLARYAGHAVRVMPPARQAAAAAQQAQGRRGHWFWGPIKVGRPLMMRAGLAALLTNVFALATSIFSMIVYDRVVPNNAFTSLYALLIGVVIVFGCDFVIRTLRGYFLDVAGSRADVEIADAIFDHVLDLDLRARRGATGTLAATLKEYDSIRDFFTSSTLTTLIDIPFALLFVAVLYWVGGPMAVVPLVAIPLMVVVGLAVRPRMKAQSEISQEDAQLKQAVLVETLTGLESIKALGAGAVMRRRWQQAIAHQARVGLDSRWLALLTANWANLVFMLSQVAVVSVGVFLAADGQVGTGAIVAGSILCGRAVQPFSQVAQLLSRLHQVLASHAALAKVMALPREHGADRPRLAHDRLAGSVDLRDVVFRYPQQTTPVLDKVSLRIQPGERVAVIGRVGSGKTTLVKLLLGLYPPDDGVLMVGGIDVRQIDPADLRRNVGSVLQDVWMMGGTLRDNIALGGDRPSDDEILRAAAVAGVQEFANLHPDGFHQQVGERGEGLSGGQRQAVAIARALIGDPPMLLLDEPTSAMDPTAERLLLQRLKAATQGKTLILVTHKPSMLELVDRVIVLERGKVIADGPKEKVLRQAAPGAQP